MLSVCMYVYVYVCDLTDLKVLVYGFNFVGKHKEVRRGS